MSYALVIYPSRAALGNTINADPTSEEWLSRVCVNVVPKPFVIKDTKSIHLDICQPRFQASYLVILAPNEAPGIINNITSFHMAYLDAVFVTYVIDKLTSDVFCFDKAPHAIRFINADKTIQPPFEFHVGMHCNLARAYLCPAVQARMPADVFFTDLATTDIILKQVVEEFRQRLRIYASLVASDPLQRRGLMFIYDPIHFPSTWSEAFDRKKNAWKLSTEYQGTRMIGSSPHILPFTYCGHIFILVWQNLFGIQKFISNAFLIVDHTFGEDHHFAKESLNDLACFLQTIFCKPVDFLPIFYNPVVMDLGHVACNYVSIVNAITELILHLPNPPLRIYGINIGKPEDLVIALWLLRRPAHDVEAFNLMIDGINLDLSHVPDANTFPSISTIGLDYAKAFMSKISYYRSLRHQDVQPNAGFVKHTSESLLFPSFRVRRVDSLLRPWYIAQQFFKGLFGNQSSIMPAITDSHDSAMDIGSLPSIERTMLSVPFTTSSATTNVHSDDDELISDIDEEENIAHRSLDDSIVSSAGASTPRRLVSPPLDAVQTTSITSRPPTPTINSAEQPATSNVSTAPSMPTATASSIISAISVITPTSRPKAASQNITSTATSPSTTPISTVIAPIVPITTTVIPAVTTAFTVVTTSANSTPTPTITTMASTDSGHRILVSAPTGTISNIDIIPGSPMIVRPGAITGSPIITSPSDNDPPAGLMRLVATTTSTTVIALPSSGSYLAIEDTPQEDIPVQASTSFDVDMNIDTEVPMEVELIDSNSDNVVTSDASDMVDRVIKRKATTPPEDTRTKARRLICLKGLPITTSTTTIVYPPEARLGRPGLNVNSDRPDVSEKPGPSGKPGPSSRRRSAPKKTPATSRSPVASTSKAPVASTSKSPSIPSITPTATSVGGARIVRRPRARMSTSGGGSSASATSRSRASSSHSRRRVITSSNEDSSEDSSDEDNNSGSINKAVRTSRDTYPWPTIVVSPEMAAYIQPYHFQSGFGISDDLIKDPNAAFLINPDVLGDGFKDKPRHVFKYFFPKRRVDLNLEPSMLFCPIYVTRLKQDFKCYHYTSKKSSSYQIQMNNRPKDSRLHGAFIDTDITRYDPNLMDGFSSYCPQYDAELGYLGIQSPPVAFYKSNMIGVSINRGRNWFTKRIDYINWKPPYGAMLSNPSCNLAPYGCVFGPESRRKPLDGFKGLYKSAYSQYLQLDPRYVTEEYPLAVPMVLRNLYHDKDIIASNFQLFYIWYIWIPRLEKFYQDSRRLYNENPQNRKNFKHFGSFERTRLFAMRYSGVNMTPMDVRRNYFINVNIIGKIHFEAQHLYNCLNRRRYNAPGCYPVDHISGFFQYIHWLQTGVLAPVFHREHHITRFCWLIRSFVPFLAKRSTPSEYYSPPRIVNDLPKGFSMDRYVRQVAYHRHVFCGPSVRIPTADPSSTNINDFTGGTHQLPQLPHLAEIDWSATRSEDCDELSDGAVDENYPAIDTSDEEEEDDSEETSTSESEDEDDGDGDNNDDNNDNSNHDDDNNSGAGSSGQTGRRGRKPGRGGKASQIPPSPPRKSRGRPRGSGRGRGRGRGHADDPADIITISDSGQSTSNYGDLGSQSFDNQVPLNSGLDTNNSSSSSDPSTDLDDLSQPSQAISSNIAVSGDLSICQDQVSHGGPGKPSSVHSVVVLSGENVDTNDVTITDNTTATNDAAVIGDTMITNDVPSTDNTTITNDATDNNDNTTTTNDATDNNDNTTTTDDTHSVPVASSSRQGAPDTEVMDKQQHIPCIL